jgi:hypothetical protein
MRSVTYTKTGATQGRHLILVDIENLTGSPSPTTAEVESAIAELRSAIPSYDDDQRIVACSHHAAATVAFAFLGARHLWRSGRDGADTALLEVLEHERVADRYDRLTICSGDGIFTDTVAWLACRGVDVTVVSRAGHLSARLQLAARWVSLLPAAAAATALGSGV